MADVENVVNGLLDIGSFIAGRLVYGQARSYFKTIDDAIVLLKEQDAVEPKTGYWIESKCLDECFWACSECNFPSEAIAAPKLYKYCPNCGTKMEDRQ